MLIASKYELAPEIEALLSLTKRKMIVAGNLAIQPLDLQKVEEIDKLVVFLLMRTSTLVNDLKASSLATEQDG